MTLEHGQSLERVSIFCYEDLGILLLLVCSSQYQTKSPSLSGSPHSLSGLTRRRLARLPGNPVLVVAPPGPADPKLVSRRMRLWNNQLGCLGKVELTAKLPRYSLKDHFNFR